MIDKKDFDKLAEAIVSELDCHSIGRPRWASDIVKNLLNEFNVEQPVSLDASSFNVGQSDTSVESDAVVEQPETVVEDTQTQLDKVEKICCNSSGGQVELDLSVPSPTKQSDKKYVKEVRRKHRVVCRKNMPLAKEKKLMEALEKRIRQFHLGPKGRQEDVTPEQMAKLDEEFTNLDIKHFSEMELAVNYIRKQLGQEDFSYLGKCKLTDLEEAVNYQLPTLDKKSLGEIVKELQSRKDRPELWPREDNDVLLVPQMNKLISFILGHK